MYRAIPEINRICAIQDRNRRYRIHQETLKKIQNTTPTHQVISKFPNQRSHSPSSFARRCSREELYRINQENQKLKNAIANQSSAFNRKELSELDMDHKRQVARLLQSDYSYGFNNCASKRRAQSKLSATPSFKKSEIKDENCILNVNLPQIQQPSKPAFIQENSELFQLDFSKIVRDDL